MSDYITALTDNWGLFLSSFLVTIELFVVSAIGSLVVGTVLASFRLSPIPALRTAGTVYVNFLRNTPLTLVFFFVIFGSPHLGIQLPFFLFGVIALTAYTSSFVCEAVRSGVNSVSPGQAEAARAVGMTFGQTLSTVLLPQAFRAITPPLFSVLIALLKNTTIAAGFSIAEAGAIRANLAEQGFAALPVLLWVVVGFLILVLPLSAAQRWFERRWRIA